MAQTHFTNLLIVVVVAFAAPGLTLLRRGAPTRAQQAGTIPSPAAAIVSTECRAPQTIVEATV